MALALPNPPVERPMPNSQEAQEDQRQLGMWRNELYRMFQYSGTATATPGTIAAGAIGTITITVTGCRAGRGQAASASAPSGIEDGLMWSAYISANDTVTVRIYNTTAAPITPANGQWSARVFP